MVFSVLWEKPPLKFSEINRGYGNSVSAVKKQSFLLEVKTNQMAAALVELQAGNKTGYPKHIKIIGQQYRIPVLYGIMFKP